MAEGNEKKFLDGGGLQRAWDRIKEYLTSWKTENFGNGTYSNNSTFKVDDDYSLKISAPDEIIGGGAFPSYYDCIIDTMHGLRVVPFSRRICYIRVKNVSGFSIRPWILSFYKEESEELDIANPVMSAHAPSMWLDNDTTTVLESMNYSSPRGAALLVW